MKQSHHRNDLLEEKHYGLFNVVSSQVVVGYSINTVCWNHHLAHFINLKEKQK